MKAHFQATNVDLMEFALVVTMPLGEWKRLKEQLTNDHPSWQLSSTISSMISQAETRFYPKPE